MAADTNDTQKSQPRPRKKGKKLPEPIVIPVPSKGQVMKDFEKIASPTEDDKDEEPGA